MLHYDFKRSLKEYYHCFSLQIVHVDCIIIILFCENLIRLLYSCILKIYMCDPIIKIDNQSSI